MKKTTILRVIALLAALLMLCACQKAVPAGGEAENTSESTTADSREPVSVNILAVGDNLIHGSYTIRRTPARRPAATTSPMPIKMSLPPLRRLI